MNSLGRTKLYHRQAIRYGYRKSIRIITPRLLDVPPHPASPLACPVRACGRPLERHARVWVCAYGHSFDIAKSGYVNLLQPQDRRSQQPGDSVDAIEARGRLLAAGVGAGAITGVADAIASLPLPERSVIVELGCGSGEMLGRLSARYTGRAVGIDLATAAVARAARTWPAITWVVANADRQLPLLGQSVNLVASVHARRNPRECARVIEPGGWLLIGVPASDDLVELREAVFGQRIKRQRTDSVIGEHAADFSLESHAEYRERLSLDASQLGDLLTGTYRGARNAVRDQRAALDAMTVTLASEILLFRRL